MFNYSNENRAVRIAIVLDMAVTTRESIKNKEANFSSKGYFKAY